MEWVKLGDCFEFIRNGANIKQFDGDGIPITRIETIARGEIDLTKVGYADLHYPSYKDYYLKVGDILMSHINSVTHLGKSALVTKEISTGFIIHGMNLLCLRPKKQQNPLYIKYFFESKVFKRQLYKITKKSVNQASFNIKDLKSLKIPNVTQNDQLRIVKELSCIRNVIAKRREQIDALDALVESVFQGLLDSPNLKEVVLNDVILEKPCRLDSENEEPISYFDISSVDNKTHDIISEKTICKVEDRPGRAKQLIQSNDILVSNVRPNLKNIAYFRFDSSFTPVASTGFTVLRAVSSKINPLFLYSFAISDEFTNKLMMKSTGANYPAVSEKEIRRIRVPLPKLELQNRFADYVTSIDAQKESLRASLSELETLFDALMQAAFSGHLNQS